MTERDLSRQVAELAALFGWKRYHSWLSKHSPAGYPDLTLCRGHRLVFSELKGEKGRLTPAQLEWLDALSGVRSVSTHVWRPSSWPEIESVLRPEKRGGGRG